MRAEPNLWSDREREKIVRLFEERRIREKQALTLVNQYLRDQIDARDREVEPKEQKAMGAAACTR